MTWEEGSWSNRGEGSCGDDTGVKHLHGELMTRRIEVLHSMEYGNINIKLHADGRKTLLLTVAARLLVRGDLSLPSPKSARLCISSDGGQVDARGTAEL